jgi:hypothetical protein
LVSDSRRLTTTRSWSGRNFMGRPPWIRLERDLEIRGALVSTHARRVPDS